MDSQPEQAITFRLAGLLERNAGRFILAVVAITALLAIPMVAMAPDETASDNPGGRVYDLEDLYNTRLPPRFHGSFYIAEAKAGDILTQAPLWDLYRNSEALRQADREGTLNPPDLPPQSYLFNSFDADRQQPVRGIYTLADAVHETLEAHPALNASLEHATDEQVKLALGMVLDDPASGSLKDLVYGSDGPVRRTVMGQDVDYWAAPALGVFVAADNERLGGGALRIGSTSDPATTNKEHFSRKVQAILRGQQDSYQLWGIAIDASLEIEDEVGTAFPFIAATFVVVLVVVGVGLRSARLVLLTALGLASMIVWLKGLSNLVGLDSSTTLDFIVPIAMISLGADFVIHAVNRYREERRIAPDPRRAFRVGMAGVMAALTLAMLTDGIAFLANTTAEIETVVGFGIGAGLAILAAFVIMGFTVPLALMRLDSWREKGEVVERSPQERGQSGGRWSIGWLVAGLARWRWVVVPVVALVTAVSSHYAFQLEATFDVRDFFKSDSDFVVGLDKLDEYVGQTAGESAIVYVEGDLADPSTLDALLGFLDRVADDPNVGKNDLGEATLQARPVFSVLEQVMASDYARSQIKETSGVSISPEAELGQFRYAGRRYRWPRSPEALRAIYDYVAGNGVPLSRTQNIYDALQVGETLFLDPEGRLPDATAIVIGIPGTRQQTNVILSRDSLADDVEWLQAAPGVSLAGLTGSPYTRQAGLDATTDGLQRALGIAVALCLVVAVVAMRSVRYAIVTIIPIGLVVAWLYAFMYAFDFGLNFVTATIAAVSIGVGIDYAVHMTLRFREELERAEDRIEALRRAADGTGTALLASAATSVLGFTIMAFAPMPMFSAYGILTAVMIAMAAAASLLVLPSLLLLATPARPPLKLPGRRAGHASARS